MTLRNQNLFWFIFPVVVFLFYSFTFANFFRVSISLKSRPTDFFTAMQQQAIAALLVLGDQTRS